MATKTKDTKLDIFIHHSWFFLNHKIPWKGVFFIGIYALIIYIDYLAVNEKILSEQDALRDAIVISITTGLIGSLVFVVLMYFLRPTIALSPFMLKADSLRNPGTLTYIFKIINCNWFFKIKEVEIRLYEFIENDRDSVRDRSNFTRNRLITTEQYVNYIEPRLHKDRKKFARNIYVVGTYVNLEEILTGQNSLEIEIVAKHELSGFSTIKRKLFKNDNNVVFEGKFEKGNNFLYIAKELNLPQGKS